MTKSWALQKSLTLGLPQKRQKLYLASASHLFHGDGKRRAVKASLIQTVLDRFALRVLDDNRKLRSSSSLHDKHGSKFLSIPCGLSGCDDTESSYSLAALSQNQAWWFFNICNRERAMDSYFACFGLSLFSFPSICSPWLASHLYNSYLPVFVPAGEQFFVAFISARYCLQDRKLAEVPWNAITHLLL